MVSAIRRLGYRAIHVRHNKTWGKIFLWGTYTSVYPKVNDASEPSHHEFYMWDGTGRKFK